MSGVTAGITYSDSPVSNNGRGLKPLSRAALSRPSMDSPVSNNGRGLKPRVLQAGPQRSGDSPVSNNGRGLKLLPNVYARDEDTIRPLAITGVD